MSDSLLQRMVPGTFVAPQRTLIGDGCSAGLGAVIAACGWGRGPAAVVADEAVVRLGLAEPILASLASAGFPPTLLDVLAGEPTLADAGERIAAIRKLGPVVVIGVGGGSALDLAKFAALAAPRAEPVEAYVGRRDDVRRELPLAVVPTTAGTGSEVTRISMLSIDKRKAIVSSASLIPDLVALDPNLVLSLPRSVTASTGLDAFCHAVESLLSTSRTPLSIANSRQALRLVSRWLQRGCDHPNDVEARRALLYGAHFAGLGLNAGVVVGHSIGYTIASRAAVTHGISVAMALPYCVRFSRSAAEPVLAEIAEEVTGRADVDGLIKWIFEIRRDLSVPDSLPAVGIDPKFADEMAVECHQRYPRPNSPVPLELPRLRRMYEALAAGDRATAPIL
jgi:alcohol dehydrogenase class IV